MPHKTLVSLFSIALLAATVLAPAVEAQRGQGRRGEGDRGSRRGQFGGGGFSRGGFGGRGSFGGGSLTGLLRIEEVQQEIKLTEDQQELVNILSDELREGRPDFPENFRDLSEEQQQAFFEKMRTWGEEQAAQAKETLKIILEEPQFKRLQEISLQQQGVNALFDSDVATALQLTPEQQAKLKETQEAIEAEREAAREERRAQGGERRNFDFEAMREEFEKARKANEEQLLAQLTEEQKQAFTALKGAPFEMPERRFGGGRDRGRRGGRGGPGGGSDRPQRPE